jgi:hypothetical protein
MCRRKWSNRIARAARRKLRLVRLFSHSSFVTSPGTKARRQQLGFTLTVAGFDEDDLQDLLAEAAADSADATSLRERFGAPPFTSGDSRDVLASCDKKVDLIFSCQPYADLSSVTKTDRERPAAT